MRKKITLLIALACILVYVVAIGFGAFRIYSNIQEQRILVQKEFADIEDLAASTAQGLGFMTEPYKEEMSNALFATKTIQAVIISGSDIYFAKERRDGIITNVNDNPRLQISPGLTQYSRSFHIDGVRNPHIIMAADIFDQEFFIITLKNTLLLILGALAVAFLTLIIETLAVKNAGVPASVKEPINENKKDPVDFTEETEEFDIPPMDMGTPDDTIPPDEFSSHYNASPEETREGETSQTGPQGLYSPHGNISWEAYTRDRLASELHRCASFEQDMVFIIMEFRGNKQKDEVFFNAFTEMAVNFFGHRDLVFEWKEDGISIIVPNIDLDQGFAKSEDFHNRVKTKLLSSSSLECELCIGLSSRAGRLIDAERLIFETSQAAARALVDPVSPIIAFKSDPEKYRAFIASQGTEEPSE